MSECTNGYNWKIAIPLHGSSEEAKKEGLPDPATDYAKVQVITTDENGKAFAEKTYDLSTDKEFQYSESEKQLLLNCSTTFRQKPGDKVILVYTLHNGDSVTLDCGPTDFKVSKTTGKFKNLKPQIVGDMQPFEEDPCQFGGTYRFKWV